MSIPDRLEGIIFSHAGVNDKNWCFRVDYRQKLKKLKGFDPSRHFVPTFYSSSVEQFVLKAAFQEIKDHFEDQVEMLRGALSLKLDQYSFYLEQGEIAVFETENLLYRYGACPVKDDLDEVFFRGELHLKNLSYAVESSEQLSPFLSRFEYFSLEPVNPVAVGDFIRAFEAAVSGGSLGISYNNGADYAVITGSEPERKMEICSDEIRNYFTPDYTWRDCLNDLTCVVSE